MLPAASRGGSGVHSYHALIPCTRTKAWTRATNAWPRPAPGPHHGQPRKLAPCWPSRCSARASTRGGGRSARRPRMSIPALSRPDDAADAADCAADSGAFDRRAAHPVSVPGRRDSACGVQRGAAPEWDGSQRPLDYSSRGILPRSSSTSVARCRVPGFSTEMPASLTRRHHFPPSSTALLACPSCSWNARLLPNSRSRNRVETTPTSQPR